MSETVNGDSGIVV